MIQEFCEAIVTDGALHCLLPGSSGFRNVERHRCSESSRRDVDFHSDVNNLDINVDKETAMFQELDSDARNPDD